MCAASLVRFLGGVGVGEGGCLLSVFIEITDVPETLEKICCLFL